MTSQEPKTSAEPTAAAGAAAVDGTAGGVADEAPNGRIPVVGIGASAGGLEALSALTTRLAHDGMAYVVVQHQAPGHDSVLTEILARKTALKVATIRDGDTVVANTIYVAPPNVEVSLARGVLHISPSVEHGARHSVDTFFRSLADDLGERALGVVLSGAGTDGTLGLRAIKEAGGFTFAQEPSTAAQSSMPQSALDAGCADVCMSPEEIGDELMRLSAHPYVARKRLPPGLLDQQALASVLERLRRAFAVDFSSYKESTVRRRIERRMALARIEKVEDYLELLRAKPAELGLLYSDLLINVTGFFRDREAFEVLREAVLPRVLEGRSAEAPLRIWVAGCATGEEAYSIAICALEALEGRPHPPEVQIFGTDIDDNALARARAAVYPTTIELDVSPARLQRFFTKTDKGYQVARQVRDLVVFARHNLGKDPPFSRLDLVSCRNVLIYMQAPLQKRVLRVFHYALNPDAFLLLGTSESLGEAADLFSPVDRKWKIFMKRPAALGSPLVTAQVPAPGAAAEPLAPVSAAAPGRRPLITIQQLADRKVLEKFAPPGVLLDENLDVVQFRGETGPYLAPSPGLATLQILKLVRPELLAALRDAIHAATTGNLTVASEPVPLWRSGTESSVVIDVMPLVEASGRRKSMLVLFHESVAASPRSAARDRIPGPDIHVLERELLVTKEYLQTTVQELEAANEELQSSNEELQSSNEELQSTNEELETSKEELQSTNEELATVNDELQTRMGQLSIANDDLENVMAAVSVAVIIVGSDLRIRRFTQAAERLLSLISGDVGRPVNYLGTTLHQAGLDALVAECIQGVRERVQRVRCSDGQWYSMRILPYRTGEHAIRGAVIEFTRAPLGRRPGETPEINELVGKVLSTLPHVLMLLDDQMRVIWVNKGFFDAFHVGTEILGRFLDEVWPERTADTRLSTALEEAVAKGTPFAGIVVEAPLGRKARPMTLSARSLPPEGDRPALTLVVMEES